VTGVVAALERVNAAIDAGLGGLLRVAVAAIAVVVVAQVFFRYVLNDALSWGEEAARYLLVLTTFLGASVAMRRRGHMAVEFFVDRLPPGARRRVDLAAQAAACLVHAVLIGQGTALALRNLDQFSPALSIPIGLLYLLLPLAGVLLLLQAVQQVCALLAGVAPAATPWSTRAGGPA
jgi:TRAP-type C4-dicarboxylate transport system permease small subunit